MSEDLSEMAYRFNVAPVGKYMTSFKRLDGDWDQVVNPDQRVDVGINPPMRTFATTCGRAIDPTHLPTMLRPNLRRRKLPDLVSDGMATLCSDKIRDIVESFEPGVHAFYPVAFAWKTGEPDESHFYWIVQNTIKALHPDHIDPPYPGPDAYWEGHAAYKYPDRRVVFSKSAIGNAHIWADPQLRYDRFMSNTLAEAFMNAEATGFSPPGQVEVI